MESIYQFLEIFLELERKTRVAHRQPDIEKYNNTLKKLHELAGFSGVGFGMAFIKKLRPTRFYEKMQKKSAPKKRMILKISKYRHALYNNLYACYISRANNHYGFKDYGDCFFVGEVEGELKIVAQYFFGDPDLVKSRWHFGGGDESIKFDSIGEPIEIERLIEPVDDEDSMEDYHKDK